MLLSFQRNIEANLLEIKIESEEKKSMANLVEIKIPNLGEAQETEIIEISVKPGDLFQKISSYLNLKKLLWKFHPTFLEKLK